MSLTARQIISDASDVVSGKKASTFINHPYIQPVSDSVTNKKRNLFSDIGIPISKYDNLYSYNDEERIRQELYGTQGVARLKNFADISPLIGAYSKLLIDRATDAEWMIVPREGGNKSDKRIKFLKEVYFEDLNRPFYDVIGEAMTNFIVGWTWFEVTYKKRTSKNNSMFKDGRIGIKSIAKIPCESIREFLIDDSCEIVGSNQFLDGQKVFLPLNKCMMFRYGPERDPRGNTPMVNAYKSYCRQRLIENTESAGIENDATGMPIISIDTEVAKGADIFSSNNADAKKTLNALQDMVKQIKGGQRAGLVLPSWQKPELLKAGGSRSFSATDALARYDVLILLPFLSAHLLLPSGGAGSYSLAETMQKVLDDSIAATVQRIATTFTYQNIPILLKLNGMSTDSHPVMEAIVKKQSQLIEEGEGGDPPKAPGERFNYDKDKKKQPGPERKRQP